MPSFSPIPSVSQFVCPDKNNSNAQNILENNFKVSRVQIINIMSEICPLSKNLSNSFPGSNPGFGISFLIMVVPLLFHLQLHDLAPIARQNFSVSSPDVDRPYVGSHRMDRLYASHLPVVPR